MIAIALSLVLSADPAAFWQWFKTNEARLAQSAQQTPTEVMDEIQNELNQLKEDGVIVEILVDPKQPGLVISADGDVAKFPAVKKLAESAPKDLKRWKVIAFRPRHDTQGELEIDGKKFTAKDFFFRVVGAGKGKVNIEIAIRGRTAQNEKQVDQAAFVLLDSVVGEYDAETKVGGIAFSPLPKKPDAAYRPLTELAKVVDGLQ